MISLCFAGFYAQLAGFSVPTQRAFIMLSVFLLAILLKRSAMSLNTLSIALFAVIIIDPVSVLSMGFWLSFTAVFIIVLISKARVNSADLENNKIIFTSIKANRIQWMIALGLLPMTVLLFQQASLISPFANMMVIPLIGMIIVPLALMASFISLFSVVLSGELFAFTSEVLSIIWQILNAFSQLPFANWQRSSLPVLHGMLALIGVIIFLMPKGFVLRYLGLILLLPLILYEYPKPQAGNIWLTVLDVGQGLAVFVQTQHHHLLYDAGAKFGKNFDLGDRVILPFLQSIGVNYLDRFIISHGDNDHSGGAKSILNEMRVKSLMTENAYVGRLNAQGFDAVPCTEHKKWEWDGVMFEVLSPTAHYEKSNDRSCVLRIWNQQYSVLLPGDIEAKAERLMQNEYSKISPVDVLLVPHHGSNTSSSVAWLKWLEPQIAVVSSGYKNRFSHPTEQIIDLYSRQKIKLFNTAYEGAISIKLNQSDESDEITPISQRKVNKHYWNHRF